MYAPIVYGFLPEINVFVFVCLEHNVTYVHLYKVMTAPVLSCSPLVSQVEGVVSDSKSCFERFMKSSLSAMSALSIKDFIGHRHSTGKLPFVDDN